MVQKKSLISKGTTIKADATNSKPNPAVRPAVKPSVIAKVSAALRMGVRS